MFYFRVIVSIYFFRYYICEWFYYFNCYFYVDLGLGKNYRRIKIGRNVGDCLNCWNEVFGIG